MTSPHYHLGYRAGSAPCGMAMLPFGMSEQQESAWISGFIRGSTDAHRRMAAQFEPEVLLMQRKQETAG